MLAALLITFREGLEAALIVGIVLSVLRRLGRSDRSPSVWSGVIAAVIASVLAALALNAVGVALEGRGEQIFEGVTMLLACGVLTWMILWMQRQGRRTQTDLEQDARRALSTDNARMLFGLAFVAVLREGIETALFLTAAAFGATTLETLIGGALGLLAAIVVGWLVYVAGKRLDLRAFFRATGLLLILFAAGLLAHGIHELQEAALLPLVIEHVWDLNPILNEDGALGSLLKALFGYNGNPSLPEVIGYVAYLVVAFLAWRRAEQARPAIAPARR